MTRRETSVRPIGLRIAGAAAVVAAATIALPASETQACPEYENELYAKFKGGFDGRTCNPVNRDSTRVAPGSMIVKITVAIGAFEFGTCSIYVKRWGGNFNNYHRAWKVAELEGGKSVTKYFNVSTHVDGVRLGC